MDKQIMPQAFSCNIDGKQTGLINLSNSKGTLVQISNYGARVVSFLVKNKAGKMQDIVIGHADIAAYQKSKERYFNAIIGRYTGRISGGKFILNGRNIQLDINNGANHLHGGASGFNEMVWQVLEHKSNKVKLTLTSPNGASGYPGTVDVMVKYTLTDKDELVIDYNAKSDKDTIINLTNHMFFNFNAGHKGDILSHRLLIYANNYLPLDSNAIPTGEIASVKNTPFDFCVLKEIGQDINAADIQLKQAQGYDHSFVLSGPLGLKHAAAVFCAQSALAMDVYTTEPALHLYSGNYLSGVDTGKYGVLYRPHSAFCLEAQHYPDSPNNTTFPTTALKAGVLFSSSTIYKVSSIK